MTAPDIPQTFHQLAMRPKRDSVAHGEWHIHAVLMVDGKEAENADHRLRISDSRLVSTPVDTLLAIGRWLDDLAARRLRHQALAKKARKK